ncbi:MAG: anti-sigma factor family protein [Bacteroidota bacterium]
MNHHQMQELLSAFADGELTPNESALVQSHLRDCHSCKLNLAELQMLRSDIKRIGSLYTAPYVASDIVRAIRHQKEQYFICEGTDLFARRLVLALTVVVIVVVGVTSLNKAEEPLLMEPYLSGEFADSTTQSVLTRGDVSKEDLLLAVSTR